MLAVETILLLDSEDLAKFGPDGRVGEKMGGRLAASIRVATHWGAPKNGAAMRPLLFRPGGLGTLETEGKQR